MKRLFIGFILLSISNHLFASDNLEFFLVSQPDTIKIITLHYSDSLPDSSAYINIDYPQIKDFENKAVEEKVNNFFKDEFEQSILWYDEIAADTSEVDSFEFNFSYSFETGFNVEYNSNKFLSISLDHYQYTGGAHGNFYSSGYNIDMKTGKVLPEPRCILADEPTGNLDPHTAQQVFAQLVEVCRERSGGLVVVTHNPDLAAALDRRLILADGHLTG